MTDLSWAIAVRIAGVTAIALAAWGVHSHGEQVGYDRGHAEAVGVKRDWDDDRDRMKLAASQAQAVIAHNEAAYRAAQQEQERQNAQAQQLLAVERARADAAHRGMLDAARRVAAAADSCGGGGARDPGAVAGGDATVGPGGLLLDVLGRADATAGDLAGYADGLRGALGVCRAEYDALRSTNE